MPADKEIVIQILLHSFEDNPSVNFVLKQGSKKQKRMLLLMEYSYFYCKQFGKIYLDEAKKTCALVIEPHKKKFTLRAFWWDLRLALGCIGLGNIKKVLHREKEIKKLHPSQPFIHLWYVGVLPAEHGKGLGSAMVKRIMQDASAENKAVYLGTSNPKNFPFYEKLGFEVAADLRKVGYGLRMYKKEAI